jgi:heme/copper-type cytochrome/quinol oxidase subunit 2
MNIKKQFVKSILTLSSILLIGVLLLTACNGAFSLQGSVNPNAEGGVDISAGSQPDTAAQPAAAPGMDQTTLILIIVGAVVLILILIMLVSRRSSGNQPPENM